VITNFLVDWELEVMTGLVSEHYMDGNLYFGQHVESDISAKLTMTVESTAQAVSEFYDKAKAGTMSFLRLKATGPVIPTTAVNYSAQVDMPVLYEMPQVITEERDGINLYRVTARLADDGTNGIIPVVVNTLATLP
jgi:hypothetical protein